MYAGSAALQYLLPRDGELCHGFYGDLSGDVTSLVNLINTAPLPEYDVGGDLFNAPEPIIEEPLLELDPITAAICLLSNGEEVGAVEAMKVAESIPNGHLLSDVFYGCKKELLEKSAIKETFDDPQGRFVTEGPVQKSISSGCLKSIESTRVKPNFEGFRRAYSEGDIHALGKGGSQFEDKVAVHSSFEHLRLRDLKIEGKMEERMEKINRYKRKKSMRNFGRKIKYACRKVLADSQPRVRGRFAKTNEYKGSAEKG